MKPTAEQQKVIDSDMPEILVEAGAGSGKTSTTVKRYIRLIGEEDTGPHNILVFTFTDKAAGELRERVRKAMSEKAAEAGEDNPDAVSMSSSWIGTFHSICSRILRAYPIEAGIDPEFRVLEATETETLKRDAFSEAVRKFREIDPASHDPFLGVYTVGRLRETITCAYEQLRSRGIDSPRLPVPEETPYPEDGLGYLRTRAPGIAATPKLHASYRKKSTAIGELPEGDPIKYDQLAPLGFEPKMPEVEKFCEVLKKTIHDLIVFETGDRYRGYMGELLEGYGASYSRTKELRSALDYEDLQLRTLALLRENQAIRNDYRSRFREIMVDEFQDTNQLQLELIKLLKADGTTLMTVGDEMQSIYGFRHADVELFRARRDRDDVTTYLLTDNFRSQKPVIDALNEVGERLDRQVEERRGENSGRHDFKKLTVGRTDQQRATAGLILTGHDNWKELDLSPLAPAIPADEEIGKVQDHFNEAEALRLAQHLRALVDDEDNEIEQGDIAILLRARTRTDIYVSALNQAGLTPYVVAGSGFWKKHEAIEVISLLSVIANPLDDNHLLGALTSPACAASTDALWLLRHPDDGGDPDFRRKKLWPTIRDFVAGEKNKAFDHVPETDRERLSEFVRNIEGLRARVAGMPLDELIEMAVTRTGYDLAILRRDETANGLANVRRIQTLAREFESANGRNLRAFLDWVILSEELDSEASVATADENSDVVRLMTVHAAKGLEFKVVCVPDLSRLNSTRHDGQLRFGRSDRDDPGSFAVGLRVQRIGGKPVDLFDWNDLNEAAKKDTEDEELRLLHVALTRAENHLVMSGVLPPKWPSSWTDDGVVTESCPMITRISCALSLDPEDPESWPATITSGESHESMVGLTKNLPTVETASELQIKHPRIGVATRSTVGRPPLDRPPESVHPDVPLSFSAISDYIDCPVRFYARRILRMRDPEGSLPGGYDPQAETLSERDHGREFGNAVHDTFERMAGSGGADPSADSVRAALESYGLDPDDQDREKRAMEMIGGFTSSDLGRAAKAGNSTPEIPILLRSGPVMIRGFIDLVVEGGERPLIIDYKTNQLDGSSVEEKMKGYELQRRLYALALARSRNLEAVDTAWVFLQDPGNPAVRTMTGPDFDQATSDLAGIVKEITSVASSSDTGTKVAGCGHCWACRKLAPGSPELAPATLF